MWTKWPKNDQDFARNLSEIPSEAAQTTRSMSAQRESETLNRRLSQILTQSSLPDPSSQDICQLGNCSRRNTSQAISSNDAKLLINLINEVLSNCVGHYSYLLRQDHCLSVPGKSTVPSHVIQVVSSDLKVNTILRLTNLMSICYWTSQKFHKNYIMHNLWSHKILSIQYR